MVTGAVTVAVGGAEMTAVVALVTEAMTAPAGMAVPQSEAPTPAAWKVALAVRTVVDPPASWTLTWRDVAARISVVKAGTPPDVYSATPGTGTLPPHVTDDDVR